MSISSILDVGNTSLIAQKLALEVTGENITNVNTPGYSRQTAVLETMPTTTDRRFPLGNGVKVAAIQRNYDSFIQAQLLVGNAAKGEATATNSALNMVQPMFNDLTTDGMGKSLQNFFNAWQDLTANPAGVPERQVVLSTGQQIVDDFHRISNYLTSVKDSMNQSLEGQTTDINDQLNQIAQLNGSIKQVEIMGGRANELRDKRELLIRQLASNVGVTGVEQSDGTVDVSLTTGELLVTGKTAGTLSLSPQAAPSTYYDVVATSPGGATSVLTAPASTPQTGKLGGTLQIRDTQVDVYLASLDELASTLATQVNLVHSAGFDLSGATADFFTPSAPAPVTAANIALNLTSASQIAAAGTDPTSATGGTGDNVNAQKVASLYDKPFAMTGGSMTMADFYNALVGTVGADVQGTERAETQNVGIVQQLETLRESNSGVSLDEELSNLIKYQKAYQGAAKLINVGTDMLDTVLSLVR